MNNKTTIIKIQRETLKRDVKPQGNSAHISIPKKYINMKAEIKIYDERFYCKGCLEWIEAKYLSNTKDLCVRCENEKKAIENNECISCKGEYPKKELWGNCKKCFDSQDTDRIKEFSDFKGDYTNNFMDNELKKNTEDPKK